jgi:hypothetical protein
MVLSERDSSFCISGQVDGSFLYAINPLRLSARTCSDGLMSEAKPIEALEK